MTLMRCLRCLLSFGSLRAALSGMWKEMKLTGDVSVVDLAAFVKCLRMPQQVRELSHSGCGNILCCWES